MRVLSKKKTICLVVVFAMVLSLVQFSEQKVLAKSDLPEAAQKRLQDAVVLYIESPDAYVNNQKIQVDTSNPDICPIVVNNRTLIPARFVAESLGAEVEWEPKTSTVTINLKGLKGKNIKLVVGSDKMLVNGKQLTLEVSAQIVNNRTYVPFRAIAEAFGKNVFYDRGLIVISSKDNIFDAKTEKTLIDGIIAKVNNLPVVGSEAKLKELLAKADNSSSNGYYRTTAENVKAMDSVANTAQKSKADFSSGASGDYSTTNVQVQGVDEADIVKTDGKYIYQVNEQKIVVAEVYPAEKMEIVSQLDFTDKNFRPNELYVDKDRLIVIGTTYNDITIYKEQSNATTDAKKISIMPPRYSKYFVKTLIYDITDRENIKKLREVETEGSYTSSRKIGSALYIVSNKYANYYYIKTGSQDMVPYYRDSVKNKELTKMDYSKIQYFPGCVNSNYMIIAGINIDNNEEEANIYSYLGSGQNIYASQENLYVAVTNYEQRILSKDDTKTKNVVMPKYENTTLVYKFSLDGGKVTYLGKGEVPGTILNQFSMDENDGYFRIATTTGSTWRDDEFQSKNNVYILNDALSIAGKLEDLAPGERIYSTRFMGNKCYMVTFKQVDPLFVIDLNPENPKMLGYLKIPGYSDYIHPYDETHIIGFGKETKEKEGGSVVFEGIKIAVFDVSDVEHPKEIFKEVIGDRESDSEVLRNHKALLFSKEKNLLALPVRVVEMGKEYINGRIKLSAKVFQGAYVYSLDLKDGFKLKGEITHISKKDYDGIDDIGSFYGFDNKNIDRILYIKDVLYTVSQSMLKANDLNSIEEIQALKIK